MSRFYVKPEKIKSGTFTLSPEDSKHALSVLRLKRGEVIELLDGEGTSYRGIVLGEEKGLLSVTLDKSGPSKSQTTQAAEITLAISVIKPEAMDLLIQKACELGVRRIVPLLSDRSVVKLDAERWKSKHERWKKIIQESCKQCGQNLLPEVSAVQSFKSFLPQASSMGQLLIATLAVPTKPLSEALKKTNGNRYVVFIGPEGDFTTQEAESAIKQGALAVNLGPLVLRAETAVFYSLSAIQFFHT